MRPPIFFAFYARPSCAVSVGSGRPFRVVDLCYNFMAICRAVSIIALSFQY